MSSHQLRVARPVTDLSTTERMYRAGLGFVVVDRFENHDGFDGIMLSFEGADYHLEFTHSRAHRHLPIPNADDLLVFYVGSGSAWERLCANMIAAGFKRVVAINPYWELHGQSFEDCDGYRVVLWNGRWDNTADT